MLTQIKNIAKRIKQSTALASSLALVTGVLAGAAITQYLQRPTNTPTLQEYNALSRDNFYLSEELSKLKQDYSCLTVRNNYVGDKLSRTEQGERTLRASNRWLEADRLEIEQRHKEETAKLNTTISYERELRHKTSEEKIELEKQKKDLEKKLKQSENKLQLNEAPRWNPNQILEKAKNAYERSKKRD